MTKGKAPRDTITLDNKLTSDVPSDAMDGRTVDAVCQLLATVDVIARHES